MKTGEIVICSTNELWGQKYPLIVGAKYTITDQLYLTDKTIFQIKDSNNNPIGIYDSRHFITLEVYREFKLKQLLENEN